MVYKWRLRRRTISQLDFTLLAVHRPYMVRYYITISSPASCPRGAALHHGDYLVTCAAIQLSQSGRETGYVDIITER